MSNTQQIVLYDGDCGLCNLTVRCIYKHEAKAQFYFCSLQSERARELLAKHGIDEIRWDTLYYMSHGHCYSRSDGALRILKELRPPLSWLAVFRCLPFAWRDWFYNLVAHNRHRFVKYAACNFPPAGLRERMLD